MTESGRRVGVYAHHFAGSSASGGSAAAERGVTLGRRNVSRFCVSGAHVRKENDMQRMKFSNYFDNRHARALKGEIRCKVADSTA